MSGNYENTKLEATIDAMPEAGVKRGHVCCGGCCDVRRATIIVNAVSVCVISLTILGVGAVASFLSSAQDADDDETQAAAADLSGIDLVVAAVVLVVQLICHSCGIFGAIKFNENLVMVSFVLYIITAAYEAYQLSILGVLINGLFAYPHWFLYNEIKSGIMSETNYPNEKQSCCCV